MEHSTKLRVRWNRTLAITAGMTGIILLALIAPLVREHIAHERAAPPTALAPKALVQGEVRQLVPIANAERVFRGLTGSGSLRELTRDVPRISSYNVGVYTTSTDTSQCNGTISTCPNSRLYIWVSEKVSGEPFFLYELPVEAKGWELELSGIDQSQSAILIVQTALPKANFVPAARNAWQSTRYAIVISGTSAKYELALPPQHHRPIPAPN